jgi:hypothetical protein
MDVIDMVRLFPIDVTVLRSRLCQRALVLSAITMPAPRTGIELHAVEIIDSSRRFFVSSETNPTTHCATIETDVAESQGQNQGTVAEHRLVPLWLDSETIVGMVDNP